MRERHLSGVSPTFGTLVDTIMEPGAEKEEGGRQPFLSQKYLFVKKCGTPPWCPEICMRFVFQSTGGAALLGRVRASNVNVIPGFKGKHELYKNRLHVLEIQPFLSFFSFEWYYFAKFFISFYLIANTWYYAYRNQETVWAIIYSLQLLILILEPNNKMEIKGDYSKMSHKIHKGLQKWLLTHGSY